MKLHKDGIIQPSIAITLPKIPFPYNDVLIAVVPDEWMKPGRIRMLLPDGMWAKVNNASIARRLRGLADDYVIDRRYDRHGRPEYRKLEA